MNNRSWLNSTLNLRCPRCRDGKLFIPVNKIADLFEMNENCPSCKTSFFIEVGFYWGAMFVSYALSSAVCLGLFILGFFVFGWSISVSSWFFVIVVLLISPYIFRLSRSIWASMFIKYDESALKGLQED